MSNVCKFAAGSVPQYTRSTTAAKQNCSSNLVFQRRSLSQCCCYLSNSLVYVVRVYIIYIYVLRTCECTYTVRIYRSRCVRTYDMWSIIEYIPLCAVFSFTAERGTHHQPRIYVRMRDVVVDVLCFVHVLFSQQPGRLSRSGDKRHRAKA